MKGLSQTAPFDESSLREGYSEELSQILCFSRRRRAMTVFWISLVPSPIRRNGASRYRRSIVNSLE